MDISTESYCHDEGTADVIPRRCTSCGELEHGSSACRPVPVDWQRFTRPPERSDITYRIMDDQLFVVDPGSPPAIKTCPTCGAETGHE